MRDRLVISERIYQALLYLYPKAFRMIYGEQMRQTFRDACRATYRGKGVIGLLGLWMPTLFDLFKTAFEERTRQGEIAMSKTRLIGLAGPLTLLVGGLWLASAVGDAAFQTGVVRDEALLGLAALPFFLSFIPLLFALLGTRLRFQGSAGAAGRFGLMLSVTGSAGVIVCVLASILSGMLSQDAGQVSWLNYAAVVCVLSIRIGFILFGVDALVTRPLPRWNLLPLLLGLSVLLSLPLEWFGVPAFLPAEWANSFLHFAFTGVCWVLLGFVMLEPGRERQPVGVG